MKFSKMLAMSRAGKQLGPVSTKGVKFPTRDPNYRGGYYAKAHAVIAKNTASFYKHPELNHKASGHMMKANTIPHNSTHPTSPARHGPNRNHATLGAPRSGGMGGGPGNPYHDKLGKFTSKGG